MAHVNLKFSNLCGMWFLDGGHALDSQSPHCTSHRENKRQIQTEDILTFPRRSLKSCWANILSDIARVWLWRSRKLLLLWCSDIFHFWPSRRAEELYIFKRKTLWRHILSYFGTLSANLVLVWKSAEMQELSPPFCRLKLAGIQFIFHYVFKTLTGLKGEWKDIVGVNMEIRRCWIKLCNIRREYDRALCDFWHVIGVVRLWTTIEVWRMKHIRFCQDLINFVERGHGHSSQKKVDTGMRRRRMRRRRTRRRRRRTRKRRRRRN